MRTVPKPPLPVETQAVTFAVHDEGGGLLGLRLAPFSITEALAVWESLGLDGTLLDVTPAWGIPIQLPVDDSVLDETGPIELVHVPPGDDHGVNASVLAAPSEALRPNGRRLAYVQLDADHAVVVSGAPQVLRSFLQAHLTGSTEVAAESERDRALDALLTPRDDGWYEVTRRRATHTETLEFQACPIHAPAETATRWIRRHGGGWRVGWRW